MDYNEKQKITKLFSDKGLIRGICFGNKSKYKIQNPKNEVIFDSLIYLSKPYHDLLDANESGFSFKSAPCNYGKLEEYQLWHGDLDLTKSKRALEEIAREIGSDLVITNEFAEKVKEIQA